MARTFDIVPLRSLIAIATTGGVHRAADSLMLSQSTVSQHIRRLEQVAGVPLVRRVGRRIAFTADGEELLGHARAILAAHDAAVRRFDRFNGSVVIGLAQSAAAVVLPTVMRRITEEMSVPDVRFHLNRHGTVREMLDRGDIDIAVTLRIAPEIAPREHGLRLCWLWSAEVAQPELCPVAEQPSAPSADAAARPSELPLVVFSPPCTLRQPSFDAGSMTGLAWRVAVEVNDLATGLDAVRSGLGAMLMPVDRQLPDGTRALVGAPPVPAFQLAVVHTDRTDPAWVSGLAEVLGAQFGQDYVEIHHHDALPRPEAAAPY